MYLAVDIGATKTLIALFSRSGRVWRKVKFPTAQGHKTFVTTLIGALKPFARRRLVAVVVAVPGIVQKNCSVRFGNRNWGDFDLLTPIKKLFDCQVFLENDGNLGALYEAQGLPGRTVFLTFSTGVGGGVVEDGRIVDEEFEPGHTVYNYRGEEAEWEDLAAASAIERRYHVDRATDLKSQTELIEVANRVYLGLPEIVRKYHPQTIVLGGPLGRIFGAYRKYLPDIKGVEYRRPKRPTESVIYGAWLYGMERCGESDVSEEKRGVKKIDVRKKTGMHKRTGVRKKDLPKPLVILPGDEKS